MSLFFDTVLVSLYFLVESQDSHLVYELNEEKMKADKADSEKKDFLAKISHEIRTPMNTIIGLSDNLLDQGQSVVPEEAMQDMKNIYSAGKSLLDVVNNIMLYSQIENGNEKVSEDEYSIVELFNELSAYANSMIDKRRVTFVYDVNSNIPSRYFGDKEKLYRILLNLLSNAIKFTNDGKITISLLADKMENGAVSLLFIVKDTGTGIKDNKIDYLFNEVKSSSMINGSGLGLVLTKKLVDLLGGTIKYESKEGMGTSFSVIVNQKVASLDPIGDVNSLYAEKINEFSYFDCSNYRMLVVDDNEIDLKVFERLLRFYRIKVDLINNGQEALEMYKRNHYDIIVVDHLMPGMDGIDTLKELKRYKKIKLPPVIVMTANVVTELKDTYVKAGFADYLTKPVDVNELNVLMKKYFNKDEVR
jgi:CheY-like chemotaxis protein